MEKEGPFTVRILRGGAILKKLGLGRLKIKIKIKMKIRREIWQIASGHGANLYLPPPLPLPNGSNGHVPFGPFLADQDPREILPTYKQSLCLSNPVYKEPLFM